MSPADCVRSIYATQEEIKELLRGKIDVKEKSGAPRWVWSPFVAPDFLGECKKTEVPSCRHGAGETSVSVEDAERSGTKATAANHRDFAGRKLLVGRWMLLAIRHGVGHDPQHVGHAFAQLFMS